MDEILPCSYSVKATAEHCLSVGLLIAQYMYKLILTFESGRNSCTSVINEMKNITHVIRVCTSSVVVVGGFYFHV